MDERVKWLALWAATGCLLALMGCNEKGNNVQEIKFDLGKNIFETAKASGVPQFDMSNVNGNISYSVVSIPPEIVTRYTRPGYEVAVAPLFAFTLYADHKLTSDDLVNDVALQFSTRTLKTHESAQAFVNQLIGQFTKSKWKRYIPETCPWVTGRSTLLDAAGNITDSACPLDPALVISAQEWPQLAKQKLRWQWIGDGRIATLDASYSYDKYYSDKPPVLTYAINLQFELEEAVKFYDAKSLQEMKAEFGEAKVAAGAAKGTAGIKLLEEAALKRGDTVIPRP